MIASGKDTPRTAFFVRRVLAYDPLPQILSGLCWIFFHSWPLFPGLLAKAFFDVLVGRAPAGLTLESLVALVVALALARIGFVYADVVVGMGVGYRVHALLRYNLLSRILERPGARPYPGTVGEAISTLRDDVEGMWGAGWAFDVVGFLVFAVGGIAILLSVNARITLLVFLPIVAVIILAHLARARLRRTRERSRAATARVTGSLGEVFGAVQAIQVAGAEDRVVDRVRRLGDERQKAMLQDRLLGLALDATFGNVASVGTGLTLLAASSAMRDGTFSVGDFALFSTYLMKVAEMTGFLGWIIATYQQMGVAWRRGAALLQGAPPATLVAHHPIPLDRPLPSLPTVFRRPSDRLESLEVVGLTLRHPESGRGIEEISFRIERGSFTAITGPIGSGKTTLLRALLGLLEPQAGEVRWNGQRVGAADNFFVPPRVAYTPQVPTLLSGTLRENLLLGLSDSDWIEQAVQAAVLERDLAGFPDGLDTVVGARGVKLSGGQLQRAAIARMVVREAELLVLDDVSSSLDGETQRVLWERIVALGATCLVTSHHPAVLERADQIIVLDRGHVVARGRLDQLGDVGVANMRGA